MLGRQPERASAPDGWFCVYDLSRDTAHIAQVQKASRESEEFGFPTRPALFGSRKWWRLIERGELPSHTLEGTIADVYWASMADYAEFKLRAVDGTEHALARQGDIRRYVAGLGVRVRRVELERKPAQVEKFLGERVRPVVLSIILEVSNQRSPAVAPGPGGAGYEIAGGAGTHVHYFRLPSESSAEQIARIADSSSQRVRTWNDETTGVAWAIVGLRGGDELVAALRSEAEHLRGSYDGYEIVPDAGETPVAFGPDSV
ncbi:MAG: hypothetical protein QOI95_2525 [Acidimicrobiaceae bacterium]